MSKSIIGTAGQLRVRVLLTSKNRTEVNLTGTSSSKNVRRDFESMKEGAIYNAVYKYLYKGGDYETVQFQVTEWDIKYFEDNVKIKRITIKGKYYSQVRDRGTGRIITTEKWKNSQKQEF